MSTTRPDWTHWNGRSSACLWEWLALSVNVEPRILGVNHFLALQDSPPGGVSWLDKEDPRWLRQLARRLGDWREQHPAKSRRKHPPGREPNSEITRKDFCRWANQQSWTLPKAFESV